MIVINRDKAEVIAKDKIRAYREPLLQELDVDYMRATETGEDTSEITSKKQELRDMTSIAEGKEVEELKIIIDDLEAKE